LSNISNTKWFRLFASCILVEGYAGSAIYDTERNALYDIDNDYLPILRQVNNNNIWAISRKFSISEEALSVFFSNFINSELGFYTIEPKSFPSIDLSWHSPFVITNSIIEIDEASNFDINDVITQLNKISCRAVQIRFLSKQTITNLKTILEFFKDSRINDIEILFPFESHIENHELNRLLEQEKRINKFLIFGSPKDEVVLNENNFFTNSIIYFKKDIRLDNVEIITKYRFKVNLEIISEATNFNLGLNRKICIDHKGDIKNYLSHNKSYGNVNSTRLSQIINDEFKEKWYVSNDNVDTCKHCQYRYACVSNSDLEKVNSQYLKTERCKFDPFTNKWKE
jgi:SPASM domain peptide maturase of grasp-with-spasm system